MRVIKLLLILLLVSRCFTDEPEERVILSSPEEITSIYTDESSLIGGIVSPLSGQLALKRNDLIVKGAQTLTLRRLYIPPSIPATFPTHKQNQEEWNKFYLTQHLCNTYKGWTYLPHFQLEFFPKKQHVRITDSNGATFDYNLLSNQILSPTYGISNLAGESPSGQYDLRNIRVTFNRDQGTIQVFAPDGTQRFYGKKYQTSSERTLLLLLKEVLPNGRILLYHYNKRSLTCIEAKDPKERFTYSRIQIDNHRNINGGFLVFNTSNNLQSKYSYIRRQLPYSLKENPYSGQKVKKFEGNPFLPYPLIETTTPSFEKESMAYDTQFLLTSYSEQKETFTCQYKGFGGKDNIHKIETLSLPEGPQDTFQPVYSFFYEPPTPGKNSGYTLVTNPDQTRIRYDLSSNLLPTRIQWLDSKGLVKKVKQFYWTPNQWLQKVEVSDGEGEILFQKTFEYDPFGNPIKETFSGPLTGKNEKETYTLTREYSQDNRNLLLKETTDNGKISTWTYLPNTHLVTSKFIQSQEKILLREFYFYDDCHNLIKTIHDDGSQKDPYDLSDVSQRTLKEYTLRQSPPFLHMPDSLEEKYVEGAQEKLLKRTLFAYDTHGNIAEEHIYGSDGAYAYTLYKTYNQRGDLLTETNPLGDQASYSYNDHGKLKTRKNFSNRLLETFAYDKKRRLIQQETFAQESGVYHTTSYDYDLQDQLIEKIDYLDNATTYAYDPITHNIKATQFPSILSFENEELPVITSTTYTPLGFPLTQTDANGNTTSYTTNAYGSPLQITYPNGSIKTYTYTTHNLLKTYTDPDGLTIAYTYDSLDRLLTKTYLSSTGTPLTQETFTYKGFNCLTQTNKEGTLTQYHYDGAGRKIRESCEGREIAYTYDSLGFLSTVTKHNTLNIHHKRDFLGQLLQETHTDSEGHTLYKIAYTYDANGNCTSIKKWVQGQEALQLFTYDPFNRIEKITDPLGYTSITEYHEDYVNPLGQKTLQILTTDPLNITTFKTQDALGNTLEKEIFNPQGETLSHTEYTYDPAGNLTHQQDHTYQETHYQSTQTVHTTYTPTHQIATLTRGYKTCPQTTHYTYYPGGSVRSQTLPDQTTLYYTYHPLGTLSSLTSSEGSIHHTFEYTLEGYLLEATDHIQNISITRSVDPFGNITSETFPNNITLQKTYDPFNRLLTLTLPSLGEIIYHYDPLYLRKVERFSPAHTLLYAHTYNTYDLSGNLLTENLINNLGPIQHTYDLKGQHTSLTSPYFSQVATYDPKGNLIHSTLDTHPHSYSYNALSQLTHEKAPTFSQTYSFDSLYNPAHSTNPLSELTTQTYDPNGNQTELHNFQLSYDPLHRLTSATNETTHITFTYDPLGRRLSKTVSSQGFFGWSTTIQEEYLYNHDEEIASFTPAGTPLTLKIQGLTSPIAIELNQSIHAPILDMHFNIRHLIDPYWRTPTTSYNYTAFGKQIPSNTSPNPFRFASKRFDPELNLIYFGKRYYSPTLSRFLTPDPAGFTDSINPYQYTLNNPFRYFDPDGQFIIAIPLLAGSFAAIIKATAAATAIAVAAWATYEVGKAVNYYFEQTAETDEIQPIVQTEQNEKKKKPTDVYHPDRDLPRDKYGNPIPDTDAPHTQLGKKEGGKGQYPKAREFDENGNPIRDIEFTDHGRSDHPNPHQHMRENNPTGGTRTREPAEPVTGWDY